MSTNIHVKEYEDHQIVRKSNDFISARYKTSLLGSKILAISLTVLEKDPKSGQVKSTLYPSQLRRILGMESDRNIYRKLKSVSTLLAGSIITIEERDSAGQLNGNFHTFSMVTNVDYVDSKLTLYYNKDLTPHIMDLRKNYTSMELSVLTGFNHNASLRLYELLKKETYKIARQKSKYVTVRYGINELRTAIGLVNTDAPYIADYMKRHANNMD